MSNDMTWTKPGPSFILLGCSGQILNKRLFKASCK